MQNKGALKFLAIALAIACAYQLSFTFVTRHVEKKAAEYAAGDAVKEQNYLDSIKSQTVSYTHLKLRFSTYCLRILFGIFILGKFSRRDFPFFVTIA